MSLNTDAAVKMIMLHGPSRVMINEVEAIGSGRAAKQLNIFPDIIFIRDDGWSLGAPGRFERAAYMQWCNEWVAFMRNSRQSDSLPPFHKGVASA